MVLPIIDKNPGVWGTQIEEELDLFVDERRDERMCVQDTFCLRVKHDIVSGQGFEPNDPYGRIFSRELKSTDHLAFVTAGPNFIPRRQDQLHALRRRINILSESTQDLLEVLYLGTCLVDGINKEHRPVRGT